MSMELSPLGTQLREIASELNEHLEQAEAARDQGLSLHRKVIKYCSLGIRAIHRLEFDEADVLLQQAHQLLQQAEEVLKGHPSIYYAGFLQDAQKEYAEGRLTQSLISGQPLPTPRELGMAPAPYLNGMAESVGEMRRYILDRIRTGNLAGLEPLLHAMDDIYYILISMDFPDALTRGLRRSTDVARGCLERTRGDLTNHFDRQKIDRALQHIEARLMSSSL